jgi:hypothetical protein
MKTPHPLYNGRLTVYTCELETGAVQSFAIGRQGSGRIG